MNYGISRKDVSEYQDYADISSDNQHRNLVQVRAGAVSGGFNTSFETAYFLSGRGCIFFQHWGSCPVVSRLDREQFLRLVKGAGVTEAINWLMQKERS
jgi:hypothetical protein